jgi:hypothetical protein
MVWFCSSNNPKLIADASVPQLAALSGVLINHLESPRDENCFHMSADVTIFEDRSRVAFRTPEGIMANTCSPRVSNPRLH